MSTTTSTRRGFFFKAGAAAAAPGAFAGAATAASADSRSSVTLASRLAELEDVAALRRIGAELIRRVNAGEPEALESNGSGVRQISGDFDAAAQIDFVHDRREAVVRLDCKATFERPIEAPGSVLLDMARAQGEGFVRDAQVQTLELRCARAKSGWVLERARLLGG